MCEHRRLIAAVALTVLAAACSSGGGKSAQAPNTTIASKSTTTTIDPTTAAILAAYRANWDVVEAVGSTFPVNPNDPRLSLHASGIQLQAEQNALNTLKEEGHFERGTVDLSPKVTSISQGTATVMECYLDHAVEMDEYTMQPVEKPDVGHTLVRFTLSQIGGEWLVSDAATLASGRTVDACDPSAS